MQQPGSPHQSIEISAVIVTFNNVHTIRACLGSLKKAAGSFRFQLILVDNASTDGTAEWLAENHGRLKKDFTQVLLFQNAENFGFTRAVNQGLSHVHGDYVLLLNPDVIVSDHIFGSLLECFQRDAAIGAVAPQLRFPNSAIQPSCRAFPHKKDVFFQILGLSRLFPTSRLFNHWHKPEFDHRTSAEVEQPQGAFLLARRKVVEIVGPLDERFPMFFSDVDWCRRIWANGWKIRFCAEAYAIHHKGHSVFQQRERMILSSHRSFVDYFRKYDRTGKEKFATATVSLLLHLALLPRLILTKIVR